MSAGLDYSVAEGPCLFSPHYIHPHQNWCQNPPLTSAGAQGCILGFSLHISMLPLCVWGYGYGTCVVFCVEHKQEM